MAALKSREIDRFLDKPDFEKFFLVLLYGPDSGLVSERADILAEKSGVDLNDPFSLIRLDSDIAAEPGKLVDEAGTISMFGGKRLIRVSGTTRRDLAKSIRPLLENPPSDAIILIESGDLKKSAGLRKQVEGSSNAAALPCYQDNDAAIQGLIREELTKSDLEIDTETQQLLASMLGADRRISRNEIQRLALYADGRGKVTLEDVQNTIPDAAALALDDIIDATASGNSGNVEKLFQKALDAGFLPDLVLRTLLAYFQNLHALKSSPVSQNKPINQLFRLVRPPLHFSRESAFSVACRSWAPERLLYVSQRLDKTILECRSQPTLAPSIAGMALLAISLEAAKSAKKRSRDNF